MGFFDKIFGHKEDYIPEDLISTGIIVNHEPIEVRLKHSSKYESVIFRDTLDKDGNVIRIRTSMDETKAVEATHWDALSEEARQALSSQGFYRKVEDADNDGLYIEL